MKKKTDHLITIILVLILVAGLSLLLYPSISNYWNAFHQTQAIAEYNESVNTMKEDQYEEIWHSAYSYNDSLLSRDNQYYLDDEQKEAYEKVLDISDSKIMGYIEIPSIRCSLPIYHGTDESILQVAIGHIEWSSLPVGGLSSHCVLSGHRGLPSAKLFTDIDQLVIGDTFMIRVLDDVLTYEVDQILIVEPQNVEPLSIVEGEDYVTLVTCTPYGINTHRLLVRGHRVNTDTVYITSDAIQVKPLIVASMIAIPILVILFLFVYLSTDKWKTRGDTDEEF